MHLTRGWCINMICSLSVVSFWRGSWYIIDVWLIPNDLYKSSIVSIVIGAILYWGMIALHMFMYSRIETWKMKKIIDLLFSYIGGWVSVFVWRGIWNIMDHLFGVNNGSMEEFSEKINKGMSGIYSHVIGTVLLICLGMLRSINACPMIVSFDTFPDLGGMIRSSSVSPIWKSWKKSVDNQIESI